MFKNADKLADGEIKESEKFIETVPERQKSGAAISCAA